MKTQTPSERFKIELWNYQVFVILSFFIDLVFVFTFFSFHYAGKLDTIIATGKVDEGLKSTFSTWKTIFTAGLVVRILLFCCGGGAAVGSGYTSYLGGYNNSSF